MNFKIEQNLKSEHFKKCYKRKKTELKKKKETENWENKKKEKKRPDQVSAWIPPNHPRELPPCPWELPMY
jgi:hypothetical protein